jgi:hypothetical protein
MSAGWMAFASWTQWLWSSCGGCVAVVVVVVVEVEVVMVIVVIRSSSSSSLPLWDGFLSLALFLPQSY